MSQPLYQSAYDCLMLTDPATKAAAAGRLYESWQQEELAFDDDIEVERIEVPGRPASPELVSPRKVPKRGFDSVSGRLKLAHAIAHIEFNAINLALDAVYRFRSMPREYYGDWLRVASEEARHFGLLSDYLESHHSHYGAYPAHNGLWEMALKTDHDVLIRMALVPRVLEARGLDVTQTMIARLLKAGDDALVAILRIIYEDEIGHVAIGSHWFKYLCESRNMDSDQTFSRLLTDYQQATLTGPMDELARTQAGFTPAELSFLANGG